MVDTPRETTDADVLDVFSDRDDTAEPLSTTDVAERLDCPRRTAYNKLSSLSERGQVRTKRVGARARVWWLPADESGAEEAPGTSNGEAGPPLNVELTHEEVLEVVFESTALAQPFVDLEDEEVTLNIDGFVPLPDGSHVQYWTTRGVNGSTIAKLPELFDTTRSVRLLEKSGNVHRVEVRGEPSSLLSTYREFGGEATWTTLEDGVIHTAAQFPATVDTEAVLDSIRDVVASDFEIGSQRLVYTPRLFTTVVEGALTDRQWTALQVAYYAGYFKEPRLSEGEDIAAQMGITRQTFHHHLRRAEDVILSHLFEPPADHDGKRKSNW